MTVSISIKIQTAAELAKWLRTACQDRTGTEPPIHLRLFALINLAQLPDWKIHEEALRSKSVLKGETVNLYDDLSNYFKDEIPPYLVEIEQQAESLQIFAEFAIKQEAISYLVADSELVNLEAHLREIREVVMPDGTGALFRFQDIHVSSTFWPMATQGQIHRILGPAQLWAVRDVCGELFSIVRHRKDRLEGAIQFTSDNVKALEEALFPWTIAAQVRGVDETLLEGLDDCSCRTLINDRIVRARKQGLKLRPDIILYCILSLQLSEGFEQEPPFAAALAKARTGQSGFVSALERVTSDEWLAISHEN